MQTDQLSVREMQEPDIPLLVSYWLNSGHDHLLAMGVDLQKIPSAEQLTASLAGQLSLPYEKKQAYCMIWELSGRPIGHCNTNPAVYGDEAYMHLHLWGNGERKKGIGTTLVRMCLPYFFKNLQLKKLYSQPYSLNPAPHRVLEKAGFEFVKEYITVPGSLNFEQPVKLWLLTGEKFRNDERL